MKSGIFLPTVLRSSNLGLAAIAALFVGGMMLTTDVAQAESTVEAANTGWFTEAQVARGQKLYEARCSTCHASEIVDGYAGWDDSVQELVDLIKAMGMPADNPGGLPPQQYIDIAAYIMNTGGAIELGEEVLAGSDAVNQARRPE